MATKTKTHQAAFAAELAELLERHQTFLFIGCNGDLSVCGPYDADDIVIAKPSEYGNCTVTAHRLRQTLEATNN